MFDFSNVGQVSNNSDALANIPDGTMFVCSLHLTPDPYSDLNPDYLVKNQYEGGLIYFCYELDVKGPAQYAGRSFRGKKAVTLPGQVERGVAINQIADGAKKCRAGDRVVAAVLAFDALVRGIPRNMAIANYDALEGRFCAVQVSRAPTGTKYLQFLSPLWAKESMSCEMLAEKFRAEMAAAQNQPPQPQPQPQPQQPPQYAAPAAPVPPPARIERNYPAAQPATPYPPQYAPQMAQNTGPNGWPHPEDDEPPF